MNLWQAAVIEVLAVQELGVPVRRQLRRAASRLPDHQLLAVQIHHGGDSLGVCSAHEEGLTVLVRLDS